MSENEIERRGGVELKGAPRTPQLYVMDFFFFDKNQVKTSVKIMVPLIFCPDEKKKMTSCNKPAIATK